MLIAAADGKLWLGVPAEAGPSIALTSGGVIVQRPAQEPELLEWAQMISARLEAKVSLWRHPKAASWVMNLVAAVLDAWSPGDPPQVRILITRKDSTSISAIAPAHYLTGYVRAEVEAVAELLRQAVRDPGARSVLDDPDRVLDAVRRTVDTGARLQLGEHADQHSRTPLLPKVNASEGDPVGDGGDRG